MIKKVNIALAVAFVILFALKGLRKIAAPRAAGNRTAETETTKADVSTLAPHVYYLNWVNFAIENTIANRNGVLLDTIRAIFPRAEFRHLRGDVPAFAKMLREDPQGIAIGYGNHRSLSGSSRASRIPLAYSRLAVMTLRQNPWRYKGPESLAGLRIVSNDDYVDFPFIERILKAQEAGDDPSLPKINVVSGGKSLEDLAHIVESGEADAFFMTFDRADKIPEQISANLIQRFRLSGEIDRGNILLHVSAADPQYAAAVIEAYEKGLYRIEASGERNRIFEYYGFEPEPLPDAK